MREWHEKGWIVYLDNCREVEEDRVGRPCEGGRIRCRGWVCLMVGRLLCLLNAMVFSSFSRAKRSICGKYWKPK
jgi:hypothetical protein